MREVKNRIFLNILEIKDFPLSSKMRSIFEMLKNTPRVKARGRFLTKSQSALEYLTTYGWAFVVMILTIAALSYAGIIRPSRLLPDKCNFGSALTCKDYTLATDGIHLKLANNIGHSIIIDGLEISNDNGQISCNSQIVGLRWNPTDILDFPVGCDFSAAGITEGYKEKISIRIEYHSVKSGSDFSKEVNGQIYATVQGSLNNFLLSTPTISGAWSFDSGSGTTVSDSSGNSNNAVLYNGAAWVPGKKGMAISFDGIDDYAEIANSPSLQITGQITIMAWVKARGLTGFADQNMILNKEGIPYEIAVHDNTGPADGIHTCAPASDLIAPFNFAFYLGGVAGLPSHNCGWIDGGGPIAQNAWTHVALTYDGSKARTYINGELKKEYTGLSGAIQNNNNPLRMGARGGGSGTTPPQTNSGALFNGIIDEVKIFNTALSATDVYIDYIS